MANSRLIRWLFGIVIVCIVFTLALFVWPTRYRYDHIQTGSDHMRTALVRINRFSGCADELVSPRGWVRLRDYVEIPLAEGKALAGKDPSIHLIIDPSEVTLTPPPKKEAATNGAVASTPQVKTFDPSELSTMPPKPTTEKAYREVCVSVY